MDRETEAQKDADRRNLILQRLSDVLGDAIPPVYIQSICELSDWDMEKVLNAFLQEGGETKLSTNQCNKILQRVFKEKSFTPNVEERIGKCIDAGLRILILMRGAPGSGKSYLAKSLVQRHVPTSVEYPEKEFILSSDDYFFNAKGQYKYNINYLTEAHDFNQRRVTQKVSLGWSPIFIDNTNMAEWEMLVYVKIALRHGYLIEILEPCTPWRNSPGRLAEKNQHGVPRDKIKAMLNKYERTSVQSMESCFKKDALLPRPILRQMPPIALQIKNNANEPQASLGSGASSSRDINMNTPVKSASQSLLSERQRPEPAAQTTPWGDYNDGPKPQRSSMPNRSNASALTNKKSNEWNPYENEASSFWGVPASQPGPLPANDQFKSQSTKSMGDVLLNLLKDPPKKEEDTFNTAQLGESEAATTVAAAASSSEQDGLKPHTPGCKNENKSFALLRQIYPNKHLVGLWDLFIRCKCDIDWAIEILLKEDELASNDNNYGYCTANNDFLICYCNEIAGNVSQIPANGESTAYAFDLPIANVVLPERQRTRGHRSASKNIPEELQEIKNTISNRVVMGDEFSVSSNRRRMRPARSDRDTQTDPADIEDGDGFEGSDEMLEIRMNGNIIEQLSVVFKNEVTLGEQLPDKLDVNVFMPRALAKELYLLCMESAYNYLEEQRQQTLKDDEYFARLINNPKYDHVKESPSNVCDLVDMEMAWSVYKDEQEMAKQNDGVANGPTDLATLLTQVKLSEIFPDIPRETLDDVLLAHNNDFRKTVHVLQDSLSCKPNSEHLLAEDNLMERVKKENELLQSQTQQTPTVKTPATASNDHSVGERTKSNYSPEERKRFALRKFEEMRNLAAHHCQLKAECYRKATEAIQKGNKGVAVYYSEVANLHKKKVDMYNHQAANCIMEVHDLTQNNSDLLDLHYLHALEAISCLDVFLDRHVATLRSAGRSSKNIFIITGRGLHSAGGVSTIKNKVRSRLKERCLRWSEVNPGLLKVRVFSATRYSRAM